MRKWTFRLLQPFILLSFISFIGVVGYMFIEHYTFLEAIYMTTLSVTTVGFSEVKPLTDAGRIFTMFMLVTSWGTFAFAITRITQFVISGEINQYFKARRIMSAIEKMHGHVIICGFGRNGRQAAQTLKVHGEEFLIIENNEEYVNEYLDGNPDLVYIVGDATMDEVLYRAGIKRAKALITALPEDADNVFIVLSARAINPNIQIISRASGKNSMPKLKKAGADSVIMPDKIGGTHMATLVSKPDVIEFIDYLSGEEGESIHMESVPYDYLPTHIKDQPLKEVMKWEKTGVNCIGIKNDEGKFVINPPDDTIISSGMKVIVLGTKWQIDRMKKNLND
ncbi:MAG: potassium channel protein [Terrimonas sp.]|nr:potassium channel protein [Terrimonas sp.]